MKILNLVLSLSLLASFTCEAAQPSLSAYGILDQKANRIHEENTTSGWSYIVSGTIALGVSIPAYYLSNDVFAKAVYSVTETLGVAAVGYGSYLVLLENDYTRFRNVIQSVPSLTAEQRNRLSASFLRENADRARNVRKIRVISHSLTGALNFVNGATASQSELKTAMYFLGAINTLAAISFAFGTTEEEQMIKGITFQEPRVEWVVGSVSGMRIHF